MDEPNEIPWGNDADLCAGDTKARCITILESISQIKGKAKNCKISNSVLRSHAVASRKMSAEMLVFSTATKIVNYIKLRLYSFQIDISN